MSPLTANVELTQNEHLLLHLLVNSILTDIGGGMISLKYSVGILMVLSSCFVIEKLVIALSLLNPKLFMCSFSLFPLSK